MTPTSRTSASPFAILSTKRPFQRRMRWILVITLVWSSVLQNSSMALGPVRLWPGRTSFEWEASVNRTHGIATSKEAMQASRRSSIVRHFQHASTNHDVWSDVVQRLEQYPQWLVRGAVTLGLFQAVPVPGGGCSLQDRFFGIDFLIFGKPQSSRFSLLQTALDGKGVPVVRQQTRRGDCTVILPIQGGLLALLNNNASQQQRQQQACLWFRLQHNEALEETRLVTEIRGYKPWLIGWKEPVPLYRKVMYLSTQSIIHAYVMWRFHKHCLYSKYCKPMPAEEMANAAPLLGQKIH